MFIISAFFSWGQFVKDGICAYACMSIYILAISKCYKQPIKKEIGDDFHISDSLTVRSCTISYCIVCNYVNYIE